MSTHMYTSMDHACSDLNNLWVVRDPGAVLLCFESPSSQCVFCKGWRFDTSKRCLLIPLTIHLVVTSNRLLDHDPLQEHYPAPNLQSDNGAVPATALASTPFCSDLCWSHESTFA